MLIFIYIYIYVVHEQLINYVNKLFYDNDSYLIISNDKWKICCRCRGWVVDAKFGRYVHHPMWDGFRLCTESDGKLSQYEIDSKPELGGKVFML